MIAWSPQAGKRLLAGMRMDRRKSLKIRSGASQVVTKVFESAAELRASQGTNLVVFPDRRMLASVTAPSPEIEKLPAGRYESLIRLAEAIRTQQQPHDLFQVLVRELRNVVQFDAIAQYDADLNKVNWHLCDQCNAAAKPSHELQTEETIAWWVQHHQEAVVIPSVEEEDRFPRMMAIVRDCGIRSLCALPMSTAHRRLGSLMVASSRPYAYSDEEVRFLSLVVNQIALALDDATQLPGLAARPRRDWSFFWM